MGIRLLFGVALLAINLASAQARDLSGTWAAADPQLHMLKVRKSHGSYSGDLYNLGPERGGNLPLNGNHISIIKIDGRRIWFSIDRTGVSFIGLLATDGHSIAGKWDAYGQVQPLTFNRVRSAAAWTLDPSPHKILFVSVEKDVRLEVLDWGGKGSPLIFIPGLGGTAHVFDDFAPRFITSHHVYAITRRGSGSSDMPPPSIENYDADRLGDDLLAVIDKLKLDRPVLIGHSIAGEELSSIGTRHPEKISALVYMEAGYGYAFYDPKVAALGISWDGFLSNADSLRRNLIRLAGAPADQAGAIVREIGAALPVLQSGMAHADFWPVPDAPSPLQRVETAVLLGEREYGPAKLPTLDIRVEPTDCTTDCDSTFAKLRLSADLGQANAFAAAHPGSRQIRISGADHSIFISNEVQVEDAINAFLSTVPE
jgi:pimeloyl-ACP methyl ester carboxylesterase